MAKVVLKRIAESLRDTTLTDRAKQSDSDLLDRFRRSRDEEAFACLVRRHGKAVLAACRQVLINPADIDDAFQATYLLMFRKIEAIKGATLGSWLYAVAHRIAVRIRSDARRRAEREGTAATRRQIESLPPDLSWLEAVAILHEELDRMPDVYRRVLLLCYLNGQSREEAAANLGWSSGAVKGRLERARKMLTNRLALRGITKSIGVLAVVTGNSAGMDCPPPRLVELTVRAIGGAASPTVAALARGAFPMLHVMKKISIGVTMIAVLAVLTGLGLAFSPTDFFGRPVSEPPMPVGSKGDQPSAEQSEKKREENRPIQGFVKDTAGSPIAGATIVAAGDVGDGERISTTSDAQGKFSFDKLPVGKTAFPQVLMIVVRDGFAPVTEFVPQGKEEVKFTLPVAAKYSGIVKDSSGRPVADAEVQVGSVHRSGRGSSWSFVSANAIRGSSAEPFYFTKTDKNGRFQFKHLEADQELIFRVSAKGYAELDTGAGGPRRNHVVKPDAKDAELVLQHEAVIQGRVISKVGDVKLDAVEVHIEGFDALVGFRRTVKLDAQGHFLANMLPAGPMSVFLVLPADIAATAAGKEVNTASGETAETSLEIIAGIEVSGRVTVRGSGEAVADVQMATDGLVNPRGFHFGVKPTDANGLFKLRLPPGKVSIRIWNQPAGYASSDAQTEGLRTVVIPANATRFAISEPFVLLKVSEKLNCQVTDASGKPVPHVKVSSLRHASVCGDSEGNPITASFDGQFTLPYSMNGPLELGRSVPLRVELSDGRRFEANALVQKDKTSEVRIPTLPDVAGPQQVDPDELAGMVVDEKGKPLGGVKVHVWDWVDKPQNYTFTGADGTFRLKPFDNRQQIEVRFRKDGYAPLLITRQQVGLKGLVIAMDRSTYFEGTVRGPDGKPAPRTVIRVDQGPKILDGGGFFSHVWSETTADAEGRYRLYVQPDEYAFHVKASGIGVARLPKTGIAHGERRSLDIRLQEGITFQARVIDSITGKPVSGLRVYRWEQKDVDCRSDDRGEVTIKEMLPGEFQFDIESDRHARWWCDEAKHEWERKKIYDKNNFQENFDRLTFDIKPGIPVVTIVAEEAVHVTGKVLDPDGKPVSGATVAPALTGSGNSLTGDTRFSVETKADGTFSVNLPASGAAQYNLVAHDGKYGEWRTWANGVLPPIKTSPGQTIDGVTLKLTRPSVVRGKVVDEKGHPVANHDVWAHAADLLENRYYTPKTTTKADGTFELKFIRPTEQSIQIHPSWPSSKDAPPGTSKTLKLKEGDVVENVVLVAVGEGQK